jgi:NADH-quinone oxidoreductase subunit G
MEEGFLTKKIAKALDCGNVDHRLRRSDFRLDGRFHGTPWMGCNIADVQAMDRILVVGSNLRNEHPLLTQRVRRAVANGAELSLVNPMDDDQLMKVSHQAICSPNDIVNVLAQILKAMSGLQRLSLCLPKSISDLLEAVVVRENSQAIAESLAGHGKEFDLINPKSALFLGNIAQYHPRYAEIYTLAEAISSLCGATFGVLFESSDRVGLDMVRVIPGQGGLNARTMLEQPRKTYVLLNVEPEFDCANPAVAKHAMEKAECVIALTSYKSSALENADVLLPIAPFTETSGTRMSMEGRVQSFTAAVKPLGEARPAWKVLRVLANTLGLDGFNFESTEQVKNEVFGGEKPSTVVWNRLNNNLRILFDVKVQEKSNVLQRLGEVPQYRMDSVVRRSSPLQKTKQVAEPVAGMNAKLMAELGVQEGDLVVVKQGIGSAKLKVTLDAGLAKGTVRVPTGYDVTASLGELMGEIEVSKA